MPPRHELELHGRHGMEMAKMNGPISRREALKNLALGAGTLLVAGAAGAAGTASPAAAKPPPPPGPLPHLISTDPLAIALSYHDRDRKSTRLNSSHTVISY